MRTTILILVLGILAGARAEPLLEKSGHADIVERAFQAISRDFEQNWAYTETSAEDGRIVVGRFDPNAADGRHWTLVSVDGEPPNRDQQRNYENEKRREHGSREKDSRKSMVRPSSLSLLEETDEYWLYAFAPVDDDEETREFMRHVDATLKVIKDGHYVAAIDLRNNGPIKPATGVKIKEFVTRLTFAPAVPGGPVVPRTVDVRVRGRAFLAIGFDETETVRFSAWEYVGPAPDASPQQR